MTTFNYTQIKKMEPREGVKYSTDYYKQTPHQREQLTAHVHQVIGTVCGHAQDTNQVEVLEEPLKGFPRTKGKPNYTALDVMHDMYEQLKSGKDLPSGILGRWNRLFEDFPEEQIDMVTINEVIQKKQASYRALFA